jgi:hypothetical protein
LLKLIKKTATNSRFAKAGLSSFYDSEVRNSSFVHLMKFSVKNPPRSAAVALLRHKAAIDQERRI